MDEVSNSKLKGVIWLCLGILSAGVIAVGLPLIISKVPWSYEKKIADSFSETSKIEICTSPNAEASLNKMLKALYPILPNDEKIEIKLYIARGPVVNAFAHLGGQIFIYDGLLSLAIAQDEIAGILAHEISHVAHRHILQGLASRFLTFGALQMIFTGQLGVSGEILNLVLNMHFTREQEAEADRDGLLRLQKASVNTLGFANFFKRLERLSSLPDLLSDHPASESRANEAKKVKVEKPADVLTSDEWQDLKNVCEKAN